MIYLCGLAYYQDKEGNRLDKHARLVLSKFNNHTFGQCVRRKRLGIKVIQSPAHRINHHPKNRSLSLHKIS